MKPPILRVPADQVQGFPELILSAPTLADAERINAVCQDPGIQEWTLVPSPYDLDCAKFFIEKVVAPEWEAGTAYVFSVREVIAEADLGKYAAADIVEVDGKPTYLVGNVSLHDHAEGAYQIGYWVDPQVQSKKVCQRSVNALLDWAFAADGLNQERVNWRCEIHDGQPNWASWRVAWNCGFAFDGEKAAGIVNKGVTYDVLTGHIEKDDPRQPRMEWNGPKS